MEIEEVSRLVKRSCLSLNHLEIHKSTAFLSPSAHRFFGTLDDKMRPGEAWGGPGPDKRFGVLLEGNGHSQFISRPDHQVFKVGKGVIRVSRGIHGNDQSAKILETPLVSLEYRRIISIFSRNSAKFPS